MRYASLPGVMTVVTVIVIVINTYLMSWGATGTKQTRSSFQYIHPDKICFLRFDSLTEPPHVFGSHKVMKFAITQQCCRRSRSACCDVIWLYSGQSNAKCCLSSTQSETCTQDTACLSYLGEHCLPSNLCPLTDHGIQSYTY